MNIPHHFFWALLVIFFDLVSNTYAADIPLGYIEKFGVINNDEIWSGNIYISGDINSDFKVTILPGTNILVAANSDKANLGCGGECEGIKDFRCLSGINYDYDNICGIHRGEPFWDEMNHVHIYIKEINAIGNPENLIVIKSSAANPGRYDWNGLNFDAGILSYVKMSNYGVLAPGNESKINNCIFTNIGYCGICCGPNNTHTQILSNTISDAGHELIDIHNGSPIIKNNFLNGKGIVIDNGNPIIENNQFNFFNNKGVAVFFIDVSGVLSTQTKISNNTMSNNTVISFACNSAFFKNNNVYSTNIETAGNCSDSTLDLEGNYWGESNIGDRIHDKNDNPLLREIIYTPLFTKPIVHVTLITPSINATGIAVKSTIEANFSDQIDPSTVSTSTFIVSNGSINIEGSVGYYNNKAIFKPLTNLAYNTKYTVTLKGSITDLSKNKMNNDYVWDFETSGPTASIDFNTDGKPDILWTNQETGENYLWYMNGISKISGTPLHTVPDTNWVISGVGDFNSDGKPDILWRNQATGQNAVWYMDGATRMSAEYLETIADLDWTITGVGDFNSNGMPDILWSNTATGQNRIWYMMGATKSSSEDLPTIADKNWAMVGVGDFNGDSMLDILWSHRSSGQNYVWYMDGGKRTGGEYLQTVFNLNWEVVGVDDFNSDGKSDVLWRNKSTGENYLWYMNGATKTSGEYVETWADTNWKIVNH